MTRAIHHGPWRRRRRRGRFGWRADRRPHARPARRDAFRHDAMMRCQWGLATTMPEITESPVTTMPMAATTSIQPRRRATRSAACGVGRGLTYPHSTQKLASGWFCVPALSAASCSASPRRQVSGTKRAATLAPRERLVNLAPSTARGGGAGLSASRPGPEATTRRGSAAGRARSPDREAGADIRRTSA